MFLMLDQRFTISNKLCSEKITKQKKKSTKCQKQNKTLNNNMLYKGEYYFLSGNSLEKYILLVFYYLIFNHICIVFHMNTYQNLISNCRL